MHKITNVKIIEKYKVKIKFEDGIEDVLDLSDLVGSGVFSSWKNLKEFNKVTIDPQTHTLCWPNGIDLCPDSLYEDVITKKQK
ncbi:DUF2442 domain-containing protein [Candidatus Margulisiibacteriota bacterium]